ncbi:MAG: tetratricopeptide repeat protein [Bacteroidota bacterium]
MSTKLALASSKGAQHTEEQVQQQQYYIGYYWRRFYVLAGMGLAVVVGVFLWQRHQHQRDAAAQRDIFPAVYCFEAENFAQALRSDGTYAGFLDIIEKYGATKTANLAHFYAGICYMRQQDYEEAIQHLKQFKAKDYLLQARAWTLIGDAYTEQQNYLQAAAYYLKAADYKPNAFFTPTYLEKAALAYETQQDYQAALRCYQRIVNAYSKDELYEEAYKHASRLEALV